MRSLYQILHIAAMVGNQDPSLSYMMAVRSDSSMILIGRNREEAGTSRILEAVRTLVVHSETVNSGRRRTADEDKNNPRQLQ